MCEERSNSGGQKVDSSAVPHSFRPCNCPAFIGAEVAAQKARTLDFGPISLKICPQQRRRASFSRPPYPLGGYLRALENAVQSLPGPPRAVSTRLIPLYAAARTSLRACPPSPASTMPNGARKVPAQARFSLRTLSAQRQSIEQAAKNRASLRSNLVLRRWHELQSYCRFSSVNARLSASGPIARATLMASLWSSSSAGPAQPSHIVTWMPPGFCPDAARYAAKQ